MSSRLERPRTAIPGGPPKQDAGMPSGRVMAPVASLRRLLALAAVGLTGGLFGPWWIRRWARSRLVDGPFDVSASAVALVLGARVHPDGTPSTALEDRLTAALELHRAGRARVILVTGNARAAEHDEPAAMKRWLCDRGVPPADVVTDPQGVRTIDSMRRARAVYGVREAIVCTQRFHLPRALYLAERVGISAAGLATDRWYRPRWRDHGREALAQARAFVEGETLGPVPTPSRDEPHRRPGS